MTSARPLPVWAGEFPGALIDPLRPEEAFRASFLEGLLGDCPDFAPYESAGGGCSNVPPGVDAHQYYQSGGAASGGVITQSNVSEWQAEQERASIHTQPTAYDAALIAANEAARFGLQLTADRATQERLIAEMRAQGAALGVNVSNCEVYANSDPLGGPTMYGSSCDVNGNAAAPALVLRPGGWGIALVEAAAAGGSPMTGQAQPVIVNGALYYPTPENPYPWRASAAGGGGGAQPAGSVSPSTGAPPPQSGGGSSSRAPQPVASRPAGANGASASTAAEGVLEQVQSLASGLPSWVWLAAAAGGFLLLSQKGGRR